MIRHIVLFQFKEETGPDTRSEMVQKLKNLKNQIPFIVELEIGEDFMGDTYSYHVGLNSLFQNQEDLATYRDHPDHVEVVKFIREVCSATVKVDYDIGE